MPLLVQKYGGTSVGSIERIEAVADKVIVYKEQGNDMVIVLSAMSGETNRLMALAGEITPKPAHYRGAGNNCLIGNGACQTWISSKVLHWWSGTNCD
jgi:aspartokinase